MQIGRRICKFFGWCLRSYCSQVRTFLWGSGRISKAARSKEVLNLVKAAEASIYRIRDWGLSNFVFADPDRELILVDHGWSLLFSMTIFASAFGPTSENNISESELETLQNSCINTFICWFIAVSKALKALQTSPLAGAVWYPTNGQIIHNVNSPSPAPSC